MTTIHYPGITPVQLTKIRFKEARKLARDLYSLKLTDFRDFVFEKEPIYDSPEGWERIRLVWVDQSSDLRLTELLIEMLSKLKFTNSNN